ncbi:MAG: hypothetical protein V8T88_09340 [Phocaeicola sp.]
MMAIDAMVKIIVGVFSHHSLPDGESLKNHSWSELAIGWII